MPIQSFLNITEFKQLVHLRQKKSYKRHFGIYHISGKRPTPFPRMVTIDYMGGGSDTIRITRDNIKTYFPKTKWIDVDYKSGFQPDN